MQMFRSITVGFAKPVGGMDEVAERTFAEIDTADYFGINGLDSSGLGCFVGIGAERTNLTADELLIFHRLAAHLSSAYRCRRRLQAATVEQALTGAEALLDASGRLLDARGPAESKAARESLQDATRSMETVRHRASTDEPTSRWRPRVSGRWTLVDVSDRGARFIAARENQTSPRGLDALTDREQQVVASAVAGRSTKEIAYELGISHATARVLLARSYSRLGVRTRRELFDLPNIRVLRGVED
jgi:DNA-binding CsgD family transcriptional regulator